MAAAALHFKTVRGGDALPFLPALARLRIRVFREYPYLYEGDMAYEEKYLRTYFSSPRSFVCLCFMGNEIVGASTGIPLEDEEASFREPFQRAGIDPAGVFYFGESVLLPEYRGRGVGKMFMDCRLDCARSMPCITSVNFCAVVRHEQDARRPAGYKPLDPFWHKYGFQKIPGLTTEYSWKEIGEETTSPKKMQFWRKEL